MAEEKKTKNTTKETTTKKKTTNANKKSTTKKGTTQTKKNTKVNQTKKNNNNSKTSNKTQQKKEVKEQKKVAPKKEIKEVETKKEKELPKVVEEKNNKVEEKTSKEVKEEKTIETEVEDTILEQTLIFDGRENQNLAEVVEKLEAENVVLEDKVIKRSKVKRIAIIVLTILIFVTIIATIFYVVKTEMETKINSQTLNSNIYDKVSQKYEKPSDIKESSNKDQIKVEFKNIKTITLAEFEKKIMAKEDMTVLIASTTCYYCAKFEPIIEEVFGELDKEIYRINVTALTTEETNRFRSYYAFTEIPTIFVLKDGVVTNDVVGLMDKATLTSWIKENL